MSLSVLQTPPNYLTPIQVRKSRHTNSIARGASQQYLKEVASKIESIKLPSLSIPPGAVSRQFETDRVGVYRIPVNRLIPLKQDQVRKKYQNILLLARSMQK